MVSSWQARSRATNNGPWHRWRVSRSVSWRLQGAPPNKHLSAAANVARVRAGIYGVRMVWRSSVAFSAKQQRRMNLVSACLLRGGTMAARASFVFGSRLSRSALCAFALERRSAITTRWD